MSYTLYIGENCHQCGDVITFLDKKKVSYKKVNIDQSEEKPPLEIFAFPALFENSELLCYGTDIMSYFNKKSRTE